MPKLIELTPEAVADAEDAAEYYRDKSQSVVRRFKAELRATLSRIEETPKQYPVFELDSRRTLLHSFPFAVVFVEEESRIVVLAIAHQKRFPGYWKR